ncbi:hypothetical protein BDR26DRAFT_915355 [Obelidium mucronatum]|nr:hypothetical protein BDR26DRAFT_915355 [Obelidium mucronatum]
MNRSVSNESSTSPHMDDTERRLEFELEQCPAPGAKKVRKLSDKRAEQVRLAQARFRAKKKMKIKELEVKLKLLTEVHNVNPTDLPQAAMDRSSSNTGPLPINETLGSSSSNSSGSGKLLRERKRVKSYAVDNDDDEDEYLPEYVVASGSVIEGRNDNDSHTNHDEYMVTSGEGEIMVDESRLDPALLEKLKRDPRGNAELLKQLPTALRRQLQVRSAQRNFWMRKAAKD